MRSSPDWGSDSLTRFGFLVVALGATACARQEMPPGGPEDVRPPVVVATTPAAFDTVTDLSTEIRFDFDERISERVNSGPLETAVSVSPTAGDYEVQHGRRSLTVKLDGGLRAGIVYRVTLSPVVSDMFGNTLVDPFELVFSTGGEAVPTTLAGEVWNRVTGQAIAQSALVAVGSDSLVHRSTADRGGIFAFRYLPAGAFDVTAFEDQNRNGQVDSTEVQGSLAMTIAAGDTVLVDIPVLTPDTSAANLTLAEAVDSVTVALLFDDFLDFEAGTDAVQVTLSSDSVDAPTIVDLMHETEYVAWVQAVTDSITRLDSIDQAAAAAAARAASRARLDSAATDSGAADTLRPDSPASTTPVAPEPVSAAGDPAVTDSVEGGLVPSDTVVVERVGAGAPGSRPLAAQGRPVPPPLPRVDGSNAGPTTDGRRTLPGRRLVARLGGPLPFDVPFEVTVDGVVNIFGLTGGGGTTSLVREFVIDSTAIRDSIAAADSALVPDSGAVQDTVAPPDTGVASSARRESGARRAPAPGAR